ncbi:MAG: hypothetical protein J6Y96_01145, partial [Mycoplasma sp.]|nr:hypothetical protein [Mycoplasma sp.]
EERVFEIETNEQDKVYKSLNNEINKENGVTDRTSKKLYSVVQKNYEDVKEKTTFGDLKTVLSELENETKSIETWCTIAALICIIFLALPAIYSGIILANGTTNKRVKLIIVLISIIILFLILIGLLIAAEVKLSSQITNLQNSMENIGDNKNKNYALIKNIETDVKYFEGKDAKETWEKDGSHDVQVWKSKKYYYESGYKEKKVSADGTITPSDHEEFLGGKTNADNLKENSKSLIKTYKIFSVIIIVTIVIVAILFVWYVNKCKGKDKKNDIKDTFNQVGELFDEVNGDKNEDKIVLLDEEELDEW